ncbi:hypothetical protein [Agarilytica rhodophyticola]|uniref:hypothetical protein n=1 Tax=Agarilytica rhodophyticola TaxID=1737490 RepID=UPI000CD801CC|nr:hypothetical protein [Agarilytica rhodophyticola]
MDIIFSNLRKVIYFHRTFIYRMKLGLSQIFPPNINHSENEVIMKVFLVNLFLLLSAACADAKEYIFDDKFDGRGGIVPWFTYYYPDPVVCDWPESRRNWGLDTTIYDSPNKIGDTQAMSIVSLTGCKVGEITFDFTKYEPAIDLSESFELSYIWFQQSSRSPGFYNAEVTVYYDNGKIDNFFMNQQTQVSGEYFTLGSYNNIEKVSFHYEAPDDYQRQRQIYGYFYIDGVKLTQPNTDPPTIVIDSNVGKVDFFVNTFAMENAGYIALDGSTVHVDDYPELVYILTNGDKFASSASLRDCRGEFLRGRDMGRGVDPGREGVHQQDQFRNHNHTFNHSGYAGVGSFGFETGTGAFVYETNYTGGSETRPRNIDLVCAIYPGKRAK